MGIVLVKTLLVASGRNPTQSDLCEKKEFISSQNLKVQCRSDSQRLAMRLVTWV